MAEDAKKPGKPGKTGKGKPDGGKAGKAARGSACPICRAPADPIFRPFCSRRCTEVDLHRWFTGSYAIPAVEPPEYDDGHPPDDEDAGR